MRSPTVCDAARNSFMKGWGPNEQIVYILPVFTDGCGL